MKSGIRIYQNIGFFNIFENEGIFSNLLLNGKKRLETTLKKSLKPTMSWGYEKYGGYGFGSNQRGVSGVAYV